MSGRVVSDTGLLIALAKVDRLDLLADLFGNVSIPPAARREIPAKPVPEILRLDAALADFIRGAARCVGINSS